MKRSDGGCLSVHGARSLSAGSLSADYPVNTSTFARVVWFICHNSKGKAAFAILSIELPFYAKTTGGRDDSHPICMKLLC
jgi:hypothetical protein